MNLAKAERIARSYEAMHEHEASVEKTLQALRNDRLTVAKAIQKLVSLGLCPEHAHGKVLEVIRFTP